MTTAHTDWLTYTEEEIAAARRELDQEALGESMESIFRSHHMSEKKVFLPLPSRAIPKVDTALDLPETRITGVHQRWPSDPDTVNRLKRLRTQEPTPEPRLNANVLIAGLLLVLVTFIVGIVWALSDGVSR